jgi:hypothetical protein
MNYRLIFCLLLIVAMVGIVSADTLIVYPSDTQNGEVWQQLAGSKTWAETRDGAGSNVANSTSTITASVFSESTTTWYWIKRTWFTINTSDIPDTATVDSAVLSLWRNDNGHNALTSDPHYGITGFSPASSTGGAVIGDYDSFGSTRYITDVARSGQTAYVYNNYSFNAAGISAISKTGFTNIMFRESSDIDNTPYTPGSYKDNTDSFQGSAYTGTSRDPFITITYTTGGGGSAPVASFTCAKNFLRIPNSVTCTDSSTNTPTSWSWNMGDGSAAKTTQNVTYAFTKRGAWGITLNATNAQGSNVTPAATNMRVVGYENYY